MTGGGFMGALGLLGTGVAALATFLAYPHIYHWSWPWISVHVVSGYGPLMQNWAPWLWSALVIWVLYSLSRSAFLLILSLGGLLAIIGVFFGRQDHEE